MGLNSTQDAERTQFTTASKQFQPDFKNVAFALANPDSQELSDTVIY